MSKNVAEDTESVEAEGLIREFFEVKNSLIGLIALINPFAIYDSSPRLAMLHNHIRQAPPVLKPDIPLILNGNETQLVAYDIRMPDDGTIVSVHRKYRKTLDTSSVKNNPLTTIIYRNFHTNEYDCVHIHEFNTNHKTYGARYIIQPIVATLHEGMLIPKGTLFARSPSKLEGDIYSTSVTCNVLAVGSPDVIEDGFGASDLFCERAGLLELKTVTRSWGKFKYLLSAHSRDPNVFKGLLDIGDMVGPDGILMVFRTKNPLFDALDVTNEALMEIDHDHDTKVHCEPGFIVYDITIESGNGETTSKPTTPRNIAAQSEKYISGLSAYYSGLLESHDNLSKDPQGRINRNVVFSPRLTQLLTRAIADKPNAPANKVAAGGRVRRARKKEKLDEYTVTIKLYKPKPLGMGAKLTDLNGK
jgi:hypothetical protein